MTWNPVGDNQDFKFADHSKLLAKVSE